MIPFYKEKMEKAEEKFLAVKQIYTTLLKMFADEMKQERWQKMNVTDVPMENVVHVSVSVTNQ